MTIFNLERFVMRATENKHHFSSMLKGLAGLVATAAHPQGHRKWSINHFMGFSS